MQALLIIGLKLHLNNYVPEIYAFETKKEYYKSIIKARCEQNGIGFIGSSRIDFADDIAQIPYDKICNVWSGDLLADRASWQDISDILNTHGKTLYVVTDNIVELSDFDNIKFRNHIFLQALNFVQADPENYLHLNKSDYKRLYNCFIMRADANRQSWFYYFYIHNLLSKGYVSYIARDASDDNLPADQLFEMIFKDHGHGFSSTPAFVQAHHQLKGLIPYRNFQETHYVYDKILSSKYSIELESYATFDDHESYFICDKAWRSLMLPTVELVFAQKNVLQRLHELGFETNCYSIGYDDKPWIQRQQAILDVVINDSIDLNWKFLKEQALHNYNHLKKLHDNHEYNFVNDVIQGILD